jgi:hypothetical protein
MKTHRRESGFALLLVLLMAACVAIMLYTEIPRVAFEAERQHELLLIDRGNQFKRAIQVFVTDKTNNPSHRYPASLDELENFNNHRYLRRRYVDPMTGKDEWRLVHINGGVLTDSVLTKAATPGASASAGPAPPAYISEQTFISDTGAGGSAGRGGGLARAMGRRPSDSAAGGVPPGGPAGGLGSDPNNPMPGGSPGMPGSAGGVGPSGMPLPPGSVPGALPGQPGGANLPGMPGMPGVAGLPGVTGAPGMAGSSSTGQTQTCTAYIGGCATTASGGTSGQPGGMPGVPPQPGSPASSALAGAINSGVAAAGGGMGSYGQPGFQANPQAQTAAAGMINSLLTTPRPGGMPTGMPGATIGGGIAGVASKYEAEGIMVVNDRTAINEWEYIFDMTKYRAPPNPVGGTPGQPVAPANSSPPGTPIGTPIGSQTPATTPNFSMPAGGGH